MRTTDVWKNNNQIKTSAYISQKTENALGIYSHLEKPKLHAIWSDQQSNQSFCQVCIKGNLWRLQQYYIIYVYASEFCTVSYTSFVTTAKFFYIEEPYFLKHTQTLCLKRGKTQKVPIPPQVCINVSNTCLSHRTANKLDALIGNCGS